MKLILVAGLLVIALCVYAEDKYTTKFDNIDLDQILQSERLIKNYVDCVLDKGACTPDGKELKAHIADALQTGCAKCSEKQKAGVKKVLHHLSEHKGTYWEDIKNKYDPNGEYASKYADLIKKEGLDL